MDLLECSHAMCCARARILACSSTPHEGATHKIAKTHIGTLFFLSGLRGPTQPATAQGHPRGISGGGKLVFWVVGPPLPSRVLERTKNGVKRFGLFPARHACVLQKGDAGADGHIGIWPAHPPPQHAPRAPKHPPHPPGGHLNNPVSYVRSLRWDFL